MTNEATPLPLPRAKLEALLWRTTHRDFRGTISTAKDSRTVLHLNPKTGGTELWNLCAFSDSELLEKLGKRVDRELERLAAMKAAKVKP